MTESTLNSQDGALAPGPLEEDFRLLFQEYEEAGAAGDRELLERLFDPGYCWVSGNGTVTSRDEHIENILRNDGMGAPAPSVSSSDLTVCGDTALLRSTTPNGLFATTVFARNEGRWQFVHAQGTLLQPPRTAIELDPSLLDRFVGNYEFGSGSVAVVTREGDDLCWKAAGRPQVRLLPLSDSKFFSEGTNVEMTFGTDDEGRVDRVTVRLGVCQESVATKSAAG